MAKKKDLSGAINRGADLFFSANDAEAQEAQQPYKAQEVPQEQLASTVQDMQAFIEAQETRRTQGRKGLKMQRMNMSFTPSNMDYLKIMAGVNGMTITRFMNYLIEQHAEANAARYQKAKEIMRDE